MQRYACLDCGRSFSSQTFSTTYWLKKPSLPRIIFHRSVACSGLRQIGRELGVSPSTVQRNLERLGRHCQLFHESHRPKSEPTEPLVLDGFRTFEYSQYWPFDLNLLVGASHFVYGFNDAELRRSGTHTPSQLERRTVLERRFGRPDPRATRKAVVELIRRIVPPGARAQIRSDEHAEYPPAFRAVGDRSLIHQPTSAKDPRTPSNPLFPVNLADLLLRHSGANHKRETIAFSKRRQAALYRAWIWLVWRNYVKSASERKRDDPPAVQLGVVTARMTVQDVLAKRLFPTRDRLSGWMRRCYFAQIPTRCIPNARPHRRTYAA